MTEAAPPYRGEGGPALWHVSEDDSVRRFVPHRAPTSSLDEELVWAIDTRHLPLYWFPRDCPRATIWAVSTTTDEDASVFLAGGRSCRVHVVEPEWLEPMRTQRVVAYRLPEQTFERWDRFWISREPVQPFELVELGDLVVSHEGARIELRTERELLRLWDEIIGSSLDYSGIRLRDARMHA